MQTIDDGACTAGEIFVVRRKCYKSRGIITICCAYVSFPAYVRRYGLASRLVGDGYKDVDETDVSDFYFHIPTVCA